MSEQALEQVEEQVEGRVPEDPDAALELARETLDEALEQAADVAGDPVDVEAAERAVDDLMQRLRAGLRRSGEVVTAWLDAEEGERRALVEEAAWIGDRMRFWARALPELGRRAATALLEERLAQVEELQEMRAMFKAQLSPVVVRLRGARSELEAARMAWRLTPEANFSQDRMCSSDACQLARDRVQQLERKAEPLEVGAADVEARLIRIQREIEARFSQRVGANFRYLKRSTWREQVAQAEVDRLAAWAGDLLARL